MLQKSSHPLSSIGVFAQACYLDSCCTCGIDFNLDFYTEAHGLDHLMDRLEDSASADPFAAKHVKLSQAIVELVSDFSLVSFCTLAIMVRFPRLWYPVHYRHHCTLSPIDDWWMSQDKESVYKVIQMVDKANGYIFGDRDKFTGDAMLNVTAPAAGFAFDAYVFSASCCWGQRSFA